MAITQTISALTAVPNRASDTPSEFANNADTAVQYLADAPAEYNAFAAQANSTASTVNTDATTASNSAQAAASSAEAASLAAEAANYQGQYNPATTYSTAQSVTEGTTWYVSQQDNNTGNLPSTSPSFWQRFDPIVIATQPDAEAGIGTGIMTSERTKQAITAQVTQAGLVHIRTENIVSSVAAVDFTDLGSTYDRYVLALHNVRPSSDGAAFNFLTSSDNGVTFNSGSTDYQYRRWTFGTSLSVSSQEAAQIQIANNVGNNGNAETGISGQIIIVTPSSSLYKAIQSDVIHLDQSGGFTEARTFGQRQHIAAINAVRIQTSPGSIDSGSISLYGVRK